MKKLNERIDEYFNQDVDDKFLQDKEHFYKEVEKIKLKEIDFKSLIEQLENNIEIIDSRIEELKNYNVKSQLNFDEVIDLIADYEEVKEIFISRLNTLKEYELKYTELKKETERLI